MQLGRKYIHPSTVGAVFLKRLQIKVKTILSIFILQYQALLLLLLLLQLVSEFSKEDPNPPTSFYEITNAVIKNSP